MSIEVLRNEIDLIKTPEIKDLVIEFLGKASDEFWTRASSCTRKYHPYDERCDGGGILHHKRAVRVADHLSKAYDLSMLDRDILIAAMIVHDMAVRCGDHKYKRGNHAMLFRDLVGEYSDRAYYTEILNVIENHMGRWGDQKRWVNATLLETLGHIADFVASRGDIIVDITVGIDKTSKLVDKETIKIEDEF